MNIDNCCVVHVQYVHQYTAIDRYNVTMQKSLTSYLLICNFVLPFSGDVYLQSKLVCVMDIKVMAK